MRAPLAVRGAGPVRNTRRSPRSSEPVTATSPGWDGRPRTATSSTPPWLARSRSPVSVVPAQRCMIGTRRKPRAVRIQAVSEILPIPRLGRLARCEAPTGTQRWLRRRRSPLRDAERWGGGEQGGRGRDERREERDHPRPAKLAGSLRILLPGEGPDRVGHQDEANGGQADRDPGAQRRVPRAASSVPAAATPVASSIAPRVARMRPSVSEKLPRRTATRATRAAATRSPPPTSTGPGGAGNCSRLR